MNTTLYLCSNPQNTEVPLKNAKDWRSYAQPLRALIEKTYIWFIKEISTCRPIIDKTMVFCFSGALLSPLISLIIQKFLSWSSVKSNEWISLFSSANIFCVFMTYNLFRLLYNIQMDGINCAKEMCDRCSREIEDIKENIEELKSRIAFFDWFVNSNPRLQAICIEYWNKSSRYANFSEPLGEKTVFEDVFAERCHFAKNQIELKSRLKERLRFVQGYTKVSECFVEHFRQYVNSFNRKQSKSEIKKLLIKNEWDDHCYE